MEANTSGSSKNTQKILFIVGAAIIVALLVIIIILSANSSNQSQSYQATLSSITSIAEQASAAQETQVAAATATPTATQPVPTEAPTEAPTATVVEPTEQTQAEAGLQIICLSSDYDIPITSSTAFTVTNEYIREATITGTTADVVIPVKACAVFLTTNQTIGESPVVELYQAKDTTPWLSKALQPVDGKANTYYAILNHAYIIDPPYWGLTYTMTIKDASQTFWSGDLNLNRTFNGLCWEGSMPDPVTLKCPEADKLEREPHPDMPTLVPGGLN